MNLSTRTERGQETELLYFIILFFLVVMGFEPWTFCALGKHTATPIRSDASWSHGRSRCSGIWREASAKASRQSLSPEGLSSGRLSDLPHGKAAHCNPRTGNLPRGQSRSHTLPLAKRENILLNSTRCRCFHVRFKDFFLSPPPLGDYIRVYY